MSNQGEDPSVTPFRQLSPAEMEEFLKLPFVRCFTCGKVLGYMRRKYKSLTDGGILPPQAFEQLGLTRQCCKMNLANPAQIAPGLLYNNPRQEKSIKFASTDAARLLGDLSVSNESGATISSISRGFSTETSIDLSHTNPADLLTKWGKDSTATGRTNRRHTSTAIVRGAAPEQSAPPEIIEIEDARITSANFTPQTLEMFKNQMLGGPPEQSRGRTLRSSIFRPPSSILDIPTIPTPAEVASTVISQDDESAEFQDLPSFPPIEPEGKPETPPKPSRPDLETVATENLFLPTTIIKPSRKHPGKMVIVRQFSGI